MRKQFPLFQSHIDLAHNIWKSIVKPGDTVVDATCGNGHDTLVLGALALTPDEGIVYALDLQKQAISNTKELLTEKLLEQQFQRIRFIQGCHSIFPAEISAKSVKLIVYNLGYMPGGDKSFTTMLGTTQQSLTCAMNLLADGGLISLTCYPGHPEGKQEEEALLAFARTLSPYDWSCTHQRWMNRLNAPSLLLIQKAF